jgi:hypothetical protein
LDYFSELVSLSNFWGALQGEEVGGWATKDIITVDVLNGDWSISFEEIGRLTFCCAGIGSGVYIDSEKTGAFGPNWSD